MTPDTVFSLVLAASTFIVLLGALVFFSVIGWVLYLKLADDIRRIDYLLDTKKGDNVNILVPPCRHPEIQTSEQPGVPEDGEL